MAGPILDPKKVQQFEQGFNSGGPDPRELLGRITQGYQQALPQGQPGAMPMPDAPQDNAHMMKMQELAEAAKRKYMEEMGVDENGDLIKK